jgi:hypothetical protein
MAATLVLWRLGPRPRDWRTITGRIVALALGGALPAAALLVYNDVTNGSPFLFGYTAVHGSLHDLGFGLRGFVLPDDQGRWVRDVFEFTPRRAVLHLLLVTAELANQLLPVFLLTPLLVLSVYQQGGAVRWGTAAIFLLLPVVQFFYFYGHARFYLELFPFVFVAIAGMIAEVGRRHRPLAWTMLAAILAMQVVVTSADVRERVVERPGSLRFAAFAAIEGARREMGKVLVFATGEGPLNWGAWFNIDTFPGDVIVARDLGEQNARLAARFPDHVPLRLIQSGQTFRLARME